MDTSTTSDDITVSSRQSDFQVHGLLEHLNRFKHALLVRSIRGTDTELPLGTGVTMPGFDDALPVTLGLPTDAVQAPAQMLCHDILMRMTVTHEFLLCAVWSGGHFELAHHLLSVYAESLHLQLWQLAAERWYGHVHETGAPSSVGYVLFGLPQGLEIVPAAGPAAPSAVLSYYHGACS